MPTDILTPDKAATAADCLFLPGIIATALSVLLYIQYREKLGRAALLTRLRSVMAIGLTLMLLGGYIGVDVIQAMEAGYAHGLPEDNAYTLAEIKSGTAKSPAMSELPDDLTGAIIIYYKFRCPDCEDVYYDMISAAENANPCYFVATGSAAGKNLLKSYPVSDAPSGVYIQHNGSVPYVTYKLFVEKDTGRSEFNTEGWERLLTLQREGR